MWAKKKIRPPDYWRQWDGVMDFFETIDMKGEIRRFLDSLFLIDLRHDLPCVLRAQDWRYSYRILRLYRRERQVVASGITVNMPQYRTRENLDRIREITRENTDALKVLVDAYGWPTISGVGLRAARAAWLIVQHSDQDHLFQRRYLEFMRDAVRTDEADARDMAYLTDRVNVAEGRSQIYGTQVFDVRCQSAFSKMTGKTLTDLIACRERTVCPRLPFQPLPIKDADHVDARRRGVGLPPLRDYILEMNQCGCESAAEG